MSDSMSQSWVVSVRMRGSGVGSVVAMIDDPLVACSCESVTAGLANGFAFTAVFLVGGDVAYALVQADVVPAMAQHVELGSDGCDVVDGVEVWVLAFEVPEERFDLGLVGRGAGSRRTQPVNGNSERVLPGLS